MKGQFIEAKKPGYPPILLIDIKGKGGPKLYETIKKNLMGEFFLRVRRIHSRYSKLILNSLSDIEITNGIVDYDSCKINIEIDIPPVEEKVAAKLDTSPLWAIVFSTKQQFIRLSIDKQTEEILVMKLFDINPPKETK